MYTKRKTVYILCSILYSLVLFLFCGDPVEPSFDIPPTIGNGKTILTVGTAEYGTAYLMFIEVDGSKPFNYQWFKDTQPLNINDDSVSFSSLSYTDTGAYYCIVSNTFGADTSLTDTLRLTIGDSLAPIILNNKAILTYGTEEKDSTFGMFIEAIGSDTLKYQWFKNGSLITGAIIDTITFDTLNYSDTGYYFCIVTNTFGADTSQIDTLSLIPPENNPPVWSVDTMHITAYEGSSCTLTVSDSCSDPDGDTILFILHDTLPIGDTIIDAKYTYTPDYTDAGIYYVVIDATDKKDTSTALLQLTVLNTNQLPVFLDSFPDDYYYVPEDSTLVITLKATDADEDSTWFILAQNTLPDNGPITFNDSQFIWQSTFNDSGYYTVEIWVTDSTDTIKAPLITVAVGDVNQFPNAVLDTATTLEDNSCIIEVLTNDSDPDGDSIYISAVSNGIFGTCTITDNKVLYTPSQDSNGTDTCSYTIRDTTRGESTAKIVVTIPPVNDPPSFLPGNNVTVHQDTGSVTVAGWATDISAGPPNESLQTLQFLILLIDTAGLFSISPALDQATGNLTFTTAGTTSGSIEVKAMLKDNGGTANSGIDSSTIATFTITVTYVNHPPVFTVPTTPTTTVILNEGGTQNVTFIISDQDGTTPSLELVSPPTWVSVTDNGNNNYTLTISPTYTVATNASPQLISDLIVKAVDETDPGLFNTHTVNITINNVNRTPFFTDPKPHDTTCAVGTSYETGLTAQDPDTDPITITLTQKPNGMVYNSTTNKVTWSIDRTMFSDADSFTVIAEVSDGYDDLTYSWGVGVGTHVWELMQDNINTTLTDDYFIAAKDSNIVLGYFNNSSSGGFKTTQKISYDGGKSFSNEFNFNTQHVGLWDIKIVNSYLYIKSSGSGFPRYEIEIFNILNEIQPVFIDSIYNKGGSYAHDFTITPNDNSLFITLNGYTQVGPNPKYSSVFDTSDVDSIYYLGEHGTLYSIKNNFSGSLIFACTDTCIFRKNRNESIYWYQINNELLSGRKLEPASYSGDTLFLINSDNELLVSINAKTGNPIIFNKIQLSTDVTDIIMINSKCGWIINSAGNVYYTNDCFVSISQEILGNNTTIDKLFIADDRISVFAYGENKLFIY